MKVLYNLMYKIYYATYRWWKIKNIKLIKLLYQINLVLFRKFLYGVFTEYLKRSAEYGVNKEQRETKVIASLTTFPARIDQVSIAIETIMMQSVKADVIELWLAKEQFPNGIGDFPENLKQQVKRGLYVRFCDDLRSHKKYFFAMQEHPNDIVITFDDDVFYPLDTIEKLVAVHKRKPQQVVGMSYCVFNEHNFYEPLSWDMATSFIENSWNLGICGCSASLFPPHVLHKKAFEPEKIKQLCYLADDLWLTAMTYMNGMKVSTLGRVPFPVEVPNTQETSLTSVNNSQIATINNNTQWCGIVEHYSQELSEWKKALNITQ